jgi:hypothetical protein
MIFGSMKKDSINARACYCIDIMITGITNNASITSKKAHVNETEDSMRVPVHKARDSLRLLSMPMNSSASPEAPPAPTKTPAPPKTPAPTKTPEPARPVPAPTRREQDPDSDPGAVPCPPSECPLPR